MEKIEGKYTNCISNNKETLNINLFFYLKAYTEFVNFLKNLCDSAVGSKLTDQIEMSPVKMFTI